MSVYTVRLAAKVQPGAAFDLLYTVPDDGFSYVLRGLSLGNQVGTGAAHMALLTRLAQASDFVTIYAAESVPAYSGRTVDLRYRMEAGDELFFWSNVGPCSCAVTAYRLGSG